MSYDKYIEAAKGGDTVAQMIIAHYYEKEHPVEAFRWLLKAAEGGHVLGQFFLGYWYEEGKGTEMNLQKAAEWYKKAAEQHYPAAETALGLLYYLGQGVERNYQQAFYWWSRGANNNDHGAEFNLGECYEDGSGVAKDAKMAFNWYQKAAEAGHSGAQNNLGTCFYEGFGCTRSSSTAVRWFVKSADLGNVQGRFNLGICYLHGEGIVKDIEIGLKWLNLAASYPHLAAQRTLFALRHYTEERKGKDAPSINYHIALCYRNGWCTAINEEEEMMYLKMAAENGHKIAGLELAQWHQRQALRFYSESGSYGEIALLLVGLMKLIEHGTQWPLELCILTVSYVFKEAACVPSLDFRV